MGSRLLYVSFENSENRASGVNKKISGQIKAFESNGYTVDLAAAFGKGIAIYQGAKRIQYPSRLMTRITLCQWAAKHAAEYHVAYIRFQFFSPFVLKMLHAFQESKVTTIMEIPTYPYAGELKRQGMKGIPKRLIDSTFGKACAEQVNTFVAPLYNGEIYGKQCLEIYNGIDVNEIKPRKAEKDDKIDMLAVAMMAPWHGYDRLIRGIHKYYSEGGQRNVVLHLVGEGVATPEYQRLIAEYNLEEHVIQHGRKSGNDLDKMYDLADIGVGSLATGINNILRTNTLKILEYMAKGLPVVCEETEEGIPADSKYRLTFASGKDPVDVKRIISFYDTIYTEKTDKIIDEIRTYCQNHCSPEAGLRSVFEFLSKRG